METKAPSPDSLSEEFLAWAKASGVEIRAYPPNELAAFLSGHRTLGELVGIGKAKQYELAKRGWTFLRQGLHDQAGVVFKGLQALDPYDAYFHTCLASLAQEAGRAEEAEQLYERALSINPVLVAALAARGELLLARGEHRRGLADLAAAVKADPQGKEPASRRARALLERQRQLLEKQRAPGGKPAPKSPRR